MKYGLHNSLQAKAGKGKELADILLQASAIVLENKCLCYLVSLDENTPDAVWITEVWESKEDHDESLKLQSVRDLIGQAMPLLDGAPAPGQVLQVLGGLPG